MNKIPFHCCDRKDASVEIGTQVLIVDIYEDHIMSPIDMHYLILILTILICILSFYIWWIL